MQLRHRVSVTFFGEKAHEPSFNSFGNFENFGFRLPYDVVMHHHQEILMVSDLLEIEIIERGIEASK